MSLTVQIEQAVNTALSFAVERDFAGPDPYDGLSAPSVGLVLPGRIGRQAWVQVLKRSGVRTRAALRIRPIRMAKTLALFTEGLHIIGRDAEANALADRLLSCQQGGPWGYEFDVQTRWAHYKAGTPNVIATSFAVRALSALGRADEINPQTLDWFYSLVDKQGYFHYTPASPTLIHNGNLLAAESVAALGGDMDVVRTATEVTLEAQRPDGSWPYGRGRGLEWIDNFHTVYVLESLNSLCASGMALETTLEAGVKFWRNHLFDEVGLPLYIADGTADKVDVHNIATAVGGLATFEGIHTWNKKALHPSVRLLISLQGGDGGFRNKATAPPFMRWNQAHAFRALAKALSSGGGISE